MITRFLSVLTCATVIEKIGIERFRGRKKLSYLWAWNARKICGSTHLGINIEILRHDEII